jgi:hypothetical protein
MIIIIALLKINDRHIDDDDDDDDDVVVRNSNANDDATK